MKILIIQTAFLGDVILATPLIEKLKLYFPDSEIDFLVRKGNETLLTNHPGIHRIISFDKKNNKYRNLFHLVKEIRAESYDYVINVHRFLTSGLMTVFSGAKVKIGFKKNPLSVFFTWSIEHHLSAEKHLNHEVERNLSLITQITDNKMVKPRLFPSEADYEKAKSFTKNEYLCIAPASIWFTKQFPVHKWIELIDLLPAEYSVFLIGANSDMDICEKIKAGSKSKQIEILAGQLTFMQSAALIKNAKMTFTNDSAPAHLASSMNAAVTEIYCSTVPEFGFGALSDVSFIVEPEAGLACRPCGIHGKKECPEGHFKCADIDVRKILERINI